MMSQGQSPSSLAALLLLALACSLGSTSRVPLSIRNASASVVRNSTTGHLASASAVQHSTSLNTSHNKTSVAAPAPAAAAAQGPAGAPAPGTAITTPELAGKMDLTAPEQGYEGKDVRHRDDKTHTGDWMDEYTYSEGHPPGQGPGHWEDGKWIPHDTRDGEKGYWKDGKWVPLPKDGKGPGGATDGHWEDGVWVPHETKDGKKGYWKDGKWHEVPEGGMGPNGETDGHWKDGKWIPHDKKAEEKAENSFGVRPGQCLTAMGLGLAAIIAVM